MIVFQVVGEPISVGWCDECNKESCETRTLSALTANGVTTITFTRCPLHG